ncbi:MAG: hypothetical protein ACYDCK_13130 [Thermoplasmatota archaeon]
MSRAPQASIPPRGLALLFAASAILAAPLAFAAHLAPAAETTYCVALDGHTFTVEETTRANVTALVRLHTSAWSAPLYRGLAFQYLIVVDKDAAAKRTLIAHEIGHALGLPHTAAFTTMNPLGALRLVDAEGLARYAQVAC